MEPSIFHSIFDNLNAQLQISKDTVNSPNSNNTTKVKISGNTFNIHMDANQPLDLPSDDKEGLHAVFLDTGQVYFGRLEIIRPDKKFVRLKNVYYLQSVTSDEKDEDISLVKLGAELHAPFDEMNISVCKIVFWEKLKDTGAVARAITENEKTN